MEVRQASVGDDPSATPADPWPRGLMTIGGWDGHMLSLWKPARVLARQSRVTLPRHAASGIREATWQPTTSTDRKAWSEGLKKSSRQTRGGRSTKLGHILSQRDRWHYPVAGKVAQGRVGRGGGLDKNVAAPTTDGTTFASPLIRADPPRGDLSLSVI